MKEVREFAANTATGQYHFNLHVLGLNNYSKFAGNDKRLSFHGNCVVSCLPAIYHMLLCIYSIPEFGNIFFVLFNFLIVSKTSFLGVHGQGCDFFKDDSLLSSVCLAGNVDSLEDDDAGLYDVPLDSESEL